LFEILHPFGKNGKKVEEERGKHEEGDLVQPVKEAIQNIQLACGGKCIKRIQNQRDKKKEDIRERERFFGIQKNDQSQYDCGQADKNQEKINEIRPNFAYVVQGGKDLISIVDDLIDHLLVGAFCDPQVLRNIDFGAHGIVIDFIQNVAFLNPCQIGRTVYLDLYSG
jgi:hypothetical protein